MSKFLSTFLKIQKTKNDLDSFFLEENYFCFFHNTKQDNRINQTPPPLFSFTIILLSIGRSHGAIFPQGWKKQLLKLYSLTETLPDIVYKNTFYPSSEFMMKEIILKKTALSKIY